MSPEKRSAEKAELEILSKEDIALKSPYLVTFPSVTPFVPEDASPEEIPEFNIYKNSEARRSDQKIVVLENGKNEWSGSNFDSSYEIPCRYAVGIRDPATNKIQICEIPLVHLQSTLKSLKATQGEHASNANRTAGFQAKIELAAAFGTKKNKQKVKNIELNKVNMEGLANLKDTLVDTIEENTVNLPSMATMNNEAAASSVLPPFDASATIPEKIYSISSIISKEELQEIDLELVWGLGLVDGKVSLDALNEELRTWYSPYIQLRLRSILASPHPKSKANQTALKRILYLHYMIKFFTVPRRKDFKPKKFFIQSLQLDEVPLIIIDKFLKVFAEKSESDKGYPIFKVSQFMSDKLLAHICVLSLIIDQFTVETKSVATSLSLSPGEVTAMYREVGCKLQDIDKSDAEILGLTSKEARGIKKAILTAPLTLPKKSQGKKGRN